MSSLEIRNIYTDNLITTPYCVSIETATKKPSRSLITKREKECLQYLAQGKSAKEIGRKLNLSQRTIEFYIENMKKKIGCKKRTELIAKAFYFIK